MPKPEDAHDYADDEARWSALMASAQRGHQEDYRELLTEISGVLRRYLTRRLAGSNDVDDCVQEVLLAVHQARHTYDPRRKFRPWLFAIARHKAIDCMRKGRFNPREDTRPGEELEIADSASELEGTVASGELIGALAEPFREAITLTKLNGLSIREAASQLSISESALKVRVHRGIRHLRKLLEAEPL